MELDFVAVYYLYTIKAQGLTKAEELFLTLFLYCSMYLDLNNRNYTYYTETLTWLLQ